MRVCQEKSWWEKASWKGTEEKGVWERRWEYFSSYPSPDYSSWTLFVRNLANNVDLDKLRQQFEEFGPIRNTYTQAKYRGFVMVSFFDIRHAKMAKMSLQGKRINGKKLDIHFALPKDTSTGSNDKVVNQGTLVVFNLDATITNEQLIQVFGAYGEIKDIRETPNKKSHKV